MTLPAWLNRLAIEHKINFSSTLQEALRERLGFERGHRPVPTLKNTYILKLDAPFSVPSRHPVPQCNYATLLSDS